MNKLKTPVESPCSLSAVVLLCSGVRQKVMSLDFEYPRHSVASLAVYDAARVPFVRHAPLANFQQSPQDSTMATKHSMAY